MSSPGEVQGGDLINGSVSASDLSSASTPFNDNVDSNAIPNGGGDGKLIDWEARHTELMERSRAFASKVKEERGALEERAIRAEKENEFIKEKAKEVVMEGRKKREELEAKLGEAETRLKEAEDKMSEAESAPASVDAALSEGLVAKLEDSQRELEETKAKFHKFKEAKAELKDVHDKLSKEHKELKAAHDGVQKQSSRLREELEMKDGMLRSLQEGMATAQEDGAAVKSLQSQLEKATSDIANLTEMNNNASKVNVERQGEIEALRSKVEELEEHRGASTRLRETESEIASLKAALEQRDEDVRKANSEAAVSQTSLSDARKSMKSYVEKMQSELNQTKTERDSAAMRLSSVEGYVTKVQALSRDLEIERSKSEGLARKCRELSASEQAASASAQKLGREASDHKSKRLTAKSEMMKSLKALDTERAARQRTEDRLKYNLVGMAAEVRSEVESAIVSLNRDLDILSAKLGAPSTGRGRAGGNIGGLEMTPTTTRLSAAGEAGGGAADQGAGEAVAALEAEISRVGGGVKLLSRTVDRLNSMVEGDPSMGCFESLLAVLGLGGGRRRSSSRGGRYGKLNESTEFTIDDDDG